MKKNKHKFKSEIHLGLLVIIFILFFLNFASNYVIYRSSAAKRENITNSFNNIAILISWTLQQEHIHKLNKSITEEFKQKYNLSSIIFIPSKPEKDKPETKKKWFKGIINNLPPRQVPDIAMKILSSDFNSLTRGENNEYFYVYPIPSASGKKLLILSRNISDLAVLDSSGRLILIVNVISILVISIVYLSLYRFILSPFRKIKKQAIDAGRNVELEDDDVEAMVEEYKKIIDELKEKESELLILNKAIQRKADSLEEFNKYLLKSISSGFITVDKKGKVLTVNHAAGMILQIDPDKYLGNDYTELFSFNSAIIDSIKSALHDDLNQPYREYEIDTAKGVKLNLGFIISVVHDKATQQIGVSILFNDLTEIRKLRIELETKNRLVALGEMAAGLAHQLRNSIGAILGYNTLTKKRLMKNDFDIEPLNSLEEETKEAESLIERFLFFARPFDYHPEKINVVELLKELMGKLKVREDYRHIEFVLTMKVTEKLEIELDKLLIKQALNNLIENAVNAYDSKKGKVELILSTTSGFMMIEIMDNGCGIADEQIEKIFTPFFSSRPSGTGLGLPLAKKIIDLHRGRLTVNSKFTIGTTFAVSLPLDTRKEDDPKHNIQSILNRK